jgi:hypothetical protein
VDFNKKHSTFFATPTKSTLSADREVVLPESFVLGLFLNKGGAPAHHQGVINVESIPSLRRQLVRLHAKKKTPSPDIFNQLNDVLIEAQKNEMPIYYLREQ